MRIIELKTWSQHFDRIVSGEQTFDIRRDDRSYVVGDRILFREYDGQHLKDTGRTCKADVTSVVHDRDDAFYQRVIAPGHCVLSLKLVPEGRK